MRRCREQPHGFTLIETLVAISVIGILAALLIPAIQHVRENSRQVSCQSNLRQIGVAMSQHLDVHRRFPFEGLGDIDQSCLAQLLPFIGEDGLYQELNFASGRQIDAILTRAVGLLQCPSDGGTKKHLASSASSYAGNAGTGRAWHDYDGIIAPSYAKTISPQSVSDGLAQTAAFCEQLVSDGSIHPRQRIVWYVNPGILPPQSETEFLDACQGASAGPTPDVSLQLRGRDWQFGAPGSSIYNHMLPPNQPTCTNGTGFDDGALTTGSMHPGIVNVLFADGHVRPINEVIALDIWRSMGTRSGQDASL